MSDRQTVCLEGNGARQSHHGPGFILSDCMYTLNTTEVHAVCYTNCEPPGIRFYAPNGNHCGAFLESDTAATLETRYHYGSGGDAALILEKKNDTVQSI